MSDMHEVDVQIVLGSSVETDITYKFKTEHAAEYFISEMQGAIIDFDETMQSIVKQIREDEAKGLYSDE